MQTNQITKTTSTWGVVFRAGQQIPGTNGAGPQTGVMLYGVVRLVLHDGFMVFERDDGSAVYTVPADVVAYAVDMQYGTTQEAGAKAIEILKSALSSMTPKGEA